tara:strand:+ start:1748 stop:3694 length:1947 start_codon:yes stop_codon:yes gene_type:complete
MKEVYDCSKAEEDLEARIPGGAAATDHCDGKALDKLLKGLDDAATLLGLKKTECFGVKRLKVLLAALKENKLLKEAPSKLSEVRTVKRNFFLSPMAHNDSNHNEMKSLLTKQLINWYATEVEQLKEYQKYSNVLDEAQCVLNDQRKRIEELNMEIDVGMLNKLGICKGILDNQKTTEKKQTKEKKELKSGLTAMEALVKEIRSIYSLNIKKENYENSLPIAQKILDCLTTELTPTELTEFLLDKHRVAMDLSMRQDVLLHPLLLETEIGSLSRDVLHKCWDAVCDSAEETGFNNRQIESLTNSGVTVANWNFHGGGLVKKNDEMMCTLEKLKVAEKLPDFLCGVEMLIPTEAVKKTTDGGYFEILDKNSSGVPAGQLSIVKQMTVHQPLWNQTMMPDFPKIKASYEEKIAKAKEDGTFDDKGKTYQKFYDLGYRHVYFRSPKDCPWGGNWGNGILIKEGVGLDNCTFDSVDFGPIHGDIKWREHRCAVSLTYKTRKNDLRLCCTHLDVWDTTGITAEQQAKKLTEWLDTSNVHTRDTLLMGDFNSYNEATYEEEEVQKLLNGYRESLPYRPLELIKEKYDLLTEDVKSEVWSGGCVSHVLLKSKDDTQPEPNIAVCYNKATDHALMLCCMPNAKERKEQAEYVEKWLR